jgi:hypothetical protein
MKQRAPAAAAAAAAASGHVSATRDTNKDANNDGKEGIKVFVRVRPPIFKEVQYANAVTASGGTSVTVHAERVDVQCTYDKVFDETAGQSRVFKSVRPLLASVLQGYNACIFAYGQTSAGKSHTMLGPNGGVQSTRAMPKDDWGVIPRAAEYLFGELYKAADEGTLAYKVKASYVQIYNENLYDLLSDSGPAFEDEHLTSSFANGGGRADDPSAYLKIREIPRRSNGQRHHHHQGQQQPQQHEVYISGLSEFRVQTDADVMQVGVAGGVACGGVGWCVCGCWQGDALATARPFWKGGRPPPVQNHVLTLILPSLSPTPQRSLPCLSPLSPPSLSPRGSCWRWATATAPRGPPTTT